MANSLSNRRYWLNWTVVCGAGEFLGIAAAAGIWVLHSTVFGEPQVITQRILLVVVMILAGVVEGLITVAVLGYLQQVRPDVVADSLPGKVRLSRKAVLITLAAFTIVIAAGFSLLACGMPDGLEWSYAERPDEPDFEPLVSNEASTIAAVDDFQSKYSLLPDYSRRSLALGEMSDEEAELSAGWTSFAGVVGSGVTMALVWLTALLLRKNIG